MTNYEARRSQEDNAGEDEQVKYAKLFVEYGGVDVLVRLLMMTSYLPTTWRYYNGGIQQPGESPLQGPRPPLIEKLFPVHRPSGLKSADWNSFFHIFIF